MSLPSTRPLRVVGWFLLLGQVALWLTALEPRQPNVPVVSVEPPVSLRAEIVLPRAPLRTDWKDVRRAAQEIARGRAASPQLQQALAEAGAALPSQGPVTVADLPQLETALHSLSPAQRRLLARQARRDAAVAPPLPMAPPPLPGL